MSFFSKAKYICDEIIDYIPESTAITSSFIAPATYVEKYLARMNDTVYFNSRFRNAAFLYLTLPFVAEGRQYFGKALGEKPTSPAYVKIPIDMVYGAIVGPLMKIGIYLSSGEHDPDKIWTAVLWSSGISLVAAPLGFYVVDVFKDVFGKKSIKESRKRNNLETHMKIPYLNIEVKRRLRPKLEKFENWLSNKSITYKKRMAYGFITVCAATAITLWYLAPPPLEKLDVDQTTKSAYTQNNQIHTNASYK
jgi:hypothetical protein